VKNNFEFLIMNYELVLFCRAIQNSKFIIHNYTSSPSLRENNGISISLYHCDEAIQNVFLIKRLDCRVATLLAMTNPKTFTKMEAA